MQRELDYDVIIIGGGPAGLSAGLMLGRCLRRTLIIDAGEPRNRFAHRMHGFLTRDGVSPLEFLKLARKDLSRYNVKWITGRVTSTVRHEEYFEIILSSGAKYRSRMMLLATGVTDKLPPIENISEFYGKSVHHCPYCDGWEWRKKQIAIYGRGKAGVALSLKLRAWSDDVVLCTNGPSRLTAKSQLELAQANVLVRNERIHSLAGTRGKMSGVVFENGDVLKRQAMFFTTGQDPNCSFAAGMGCRLSRKGVVITNKVAGTGVKGLYVAGDASRDMQFVVVAAAEGAKAGVAIHEALIARDRQELPVNKQRRRSRTSRK